ncbi:MAG TPA: DUF1206 domain-containing protein [Gaiellaceae bacterium]|nr:DUF1206 domain-containing protein [Gaiellaceae bacterium]
MVAAKHEAKEAARGPFGRGLARWGLVSKGSLYILVGVIAAHVSVGGGERLRDREGALAAVADNWLGNVLVVLLAVGLAGYAAWRLAQGVLGRPLEGGEKEGWPKRIGYFARAGWYLVLLGVAISVLGGAEESGGSQQEDRYTARVLELPLGRWIVAGLGLAILGAAGFNVWRAVTRSFRKKLKLRKMSETEDKVFTAIGVVGHLARGVVFGLIGVFLLRAAWQYDPKEAVGLDGALAEVLRADYGDTLLGLVSAGLIAYGLYCFVEARYREV